MDVSESARALVEQRRLAREKARVELEQLEARRLVLQQQVTPGTEIEDELEATDAELQTAYGVRATLAKDKDKNSAEWTTAFRQQAALSARRRALDEERKALEREQSRVTQMTLTCTTTNENITNKERSNEVSIRELNRKHKELAKSLIDAQHEADTQHSVPTTLASPLVSRPLPPTHLPAPTAVMGAGTVSTRSFYESDHTRDPLAELPFGGTGVGGVYESEDEDATELPGQGSNDAESEEARIRRWQKTAENIVKYEGVLVAFDCSHESCRQSEDEPANTPNKNTGQFFSPRGFAAHYGKAHKASLQDKTGQVMETITSREALDAPYCHKRPVTDEEKAALDRGEKPWAHILVKPGHRGDSTGAQLRKSVSDANENSPDVSGSSSSTSHPSQAKKRVNSMSMPEYSAKKRRHRKPSSSSGGHSATDANIDSETESGTSSVHPPTPAFGSVPTHSSTRATSPAKPTLKLPHQGWASFKQTLPKGDDGSVSPLTPPGHKS